MDDYTTNIIDEIEVTNDNKVGFISMLDMSDKELDSLLDYLEFKKGVKSIRYFISIVGKEEFLSILDLFAGDTFRIPSRDESMRLANKSIIYNYLKSRNFTEDAYAKAKQIFKRKTDYMENIVHEFEEIERLKEEYDE